VDVKYTYNPAKGDLIVLLILAELMTVFENINNINECEKNQQKRVILAHLYRIWVTNRYIYI
jgi:hypothetical protein